MAEWLRFWRPDGQSKWAHGFISAPRTFPPRSSPRSKILICPQGEKLPRGQLAVFGYFQEPPGCLWGKKGVAHHPPYLNFPQEKLLSGTTCFPLSGGTKKGQVFLILAPLAPSSTLISFTSHLSVLTICSSLCAPSNLSYFDEYKNILDIRCLLVFFFFRLPFYFTMVGLWCLVWAGWSFAEGATKLIVRNC